MAMSEPTQPLAGAPAAAAKARTSFGILGAISLSHLLNDMIQSLILAIYPLLQAEFSLTFVQIGLITLTFQLASSLLQPVVGKPKAIIANPLPRNKVVLAVSVLLLLIFSKYFYMASISSYYTFYLMQKFGLSIQNAQLHLFAFLFAVAAGTVIGGPVGDKIGRKYVIWGSILGVAPFTLVLPYATLYWTGILTVIIGFILASAFSAILVYAQELLPGRIGMVSGLFFGFAFGMGGLGAAVLGLIADHTSIYLVYKICAFLPLLGILTIFLPDNRHKS